jgi:uridine phosphorylase
METSAYYAFAQMMGHKALSVNAIIANRISGRFTKNSNKIVDRMIRIILDRL